MATKTNASMQNPAILDHPGHPRSRSCLSVLRCMSSSVMPWYTRVSFHTGLRVLRRVFVLSLFDCGSDTRRRNYTPKIQLWARERSQAAPLS